MATLTWDWTTFTTTNTVAYTNTQPWEFLTYDTNYNFVRQEAAIWKIYSQYKIGKYDDIIIDWHKFTYEQLKKYLRKYMWYDL